MPVHNDQQHGSTYTCFRAGCAYCMFSNLQAELLDEPQRRNAAVVSFQWTPILPAIG